MSGCDCGCAQCALDRSRGVKTPSHDVPRSVSGAAVPTKSKFASIRAKMASALPGKLDLNPPAIGLKPLGTGFQGAGAATRAAPPSVKDTPTSPKLSSYAELRRRIAASLR